MQRTAGIAIALAALAGLLPLAASAEPPYGGQGCWVSIFKKEGFGPPSARIDGPTFVASTKTRPVVEPDLRNVGGQNFVRKIHSLITGPDAAVVVYAQTNYTGARHEFGPGKKVSDLSSGFAQPIASMRVRCVDRNGIAPGRGQSPQ